MCCDHKLMNEITSTGNIQELFMIFIVIEHNRHSGHTPLSQHSIGDNIETGGKGSRDLLSEQ